MAKLLSSLPVGAKVKDINSKYYGSPVIWQIADKNHAGYPANSVTLISEKILCLKAFDGREPSNPDSERKKYGNNNYKVSNILQWLNSAAAAGKWYSGKHSYDAPPAKANSVNYNGYDTEAGFLNGFSAGFVAALLNTTIGIVKNTVIDGGGSEYVITKLFLASTAEVGISTESGTTEGSKLALFNGDKSREAYPTADAVSKSDFSSTSFMVDSPWEWWLRTPNTQTSYAVHHVTSSGTLNFGASAYNGIVGVRPLCNLPSSILISDSPDSDGAYRIILNTAPTISGTDSNLGDKNLGFVISYKVNDVDTSDSLVVTEKLNNSILQTINGAPRNQDLEIEITNEMLFALELNSTNTIEIKVDDQQSGIAYRRYTFRRTNSAPVIDGQDKDLGQKIEPFAVDFSVSDNEGNAITIKTYLNNILKEEYVATDGATNIFTISKEDWHKLKIGQHSIKIEATDENGATAVRNYTFTRYDDKIQFTLKAPIETDIMATKILVTPTWTIPEGATVKVSACNNAFDEVPTWEDITSQVNISRHYNFTNDVKTADKWGINIKVSIEKSTATEEVVINGFGGAFE